MGTWAELTSQVFGKLSLPLNTTGDVKTIVQSALYEAYMEMVKDVNPPEFLTKASYTGFADPATTLSLTSDFAVSNFATSFCLNINEDPTATGSEPSAWREMSWEKWVKTFSGSLDARPERYWTLDPSLVFHFSSLPAGTESWNVDFYYYKDPAPFADASTPEIHKQHHDTIVNGATVRFPEYFSGDRANLFSVHSQAWNRGLLSYQQEKAATRSFNRIRPKGRRIGRNGFKINWGSWEA